MACDGEIIVRDNQLLEIDTEGKTVSWREAKIWTRQPERGKQGTDGALTDGRSSLQVSDADLRPDSPKMLGGEASVAVVGGGLGAEEAGVVERGGVDFLLRSALP